MNRGQRRPLILRTAALAEHYAGMELEAAAQAAAAQAGAPVPQVLVASDSPAALGDPFLICDEIAGETIVRRIQRRLDDEGRSRLLAQCAQALAAVHAARADAPGARRAGSAHRVPPASRRDGRHHRDIRVGLPLARRSPPRPIGTQDGARRLPDGQPDHRRLHPGRARAGLGTGAHRRDIRGPGLVLHSRLAVRRPAELSAGGLGTIEDFVSAYEQAGGGPVDRTVLHWWLVLATLRWGVICRVQAERHLRADPVGGTRRVGRRVCETEWDILDLLEGRSWKGHHGRPTAAELIDAVAGFLEGEVRANTTGAVNFHALVAANALRIVERELRDDRDPPTYLGYLNEDSLAAAIRAGELDGRDAEVLAGLRRGRPPARDCASGLRRSHAFS